LAIIACSFVVLDSTIALLAEALAFLRPVGDASTMAIADVVCASLLFNPWA
jgi:hypothetical protein